MNMIPVNSSNLVSVGYDSFNQVLRIKFYSGTYDYFNVPENIFNDLLSASSKGKYHHRFIKNDFPYKKIG